MKLSIKEVIISFNKQLFSRNRSNIAPWVLPVAIGGSIFLLALIVIGFLTYTNNKKNQVLKDKEKDVKNKTNELEEVKGKIIEKDKKITEKDKKITEKDKQLQETGTKYNNTLSANQTLAESGKNKDAAIKQLQIKIAEAAQNPEKQEELKQFIKDNINTGNDQLYSDLVGKDGIIAKKVQDIFDQNVANVQNSQEILNQLKNLS